MTAFKKDLLILFIFIYAAGVVFLKTPGIFASASSDPLAGKILLQVQSSGEAWYVNPFDGKRYFLGRPNDAFALMRKLGVGVTNDNLNKIGVGNENFASSIDTDSDGLSDALEDSFGTDKNKADTDGDGYSDRVEILTDYNPVGAGKFPLDNKFAQRQSGKILLQVEKNGEAWYVNPTDNKRYFLGRPEDAFNLMKKLGLGITNNDLAKITADSPFLNQLSKNVSSTVPAIAPVIVEPQIPTIASSTPLSPNQSTPLPVNLNCNSLDCLIAKAPDCQKGSATFSFAIPFPLSAKLTVNGDTYIEIAGKNADGTCAFTQRLVGGMVTISEKDRQGFIALGISAAQIDAQLAAANQSLNSEATKSIMTCAGSGANLAQYLSSAKNSVLKSNCAAVILSPESQCTIEPGLVCVLKAQ